MVVAEVDVVLVVVEVAVVVVGEVSVHSKKTARFFRSRALLGWRNLPRWE